MGIVSGTSRLVEQAGSFFSYKYVKPVILAAGSVAGTAGLLFVANVFRAPAVTDVNGERQEIIADYVGHALPTNTRDQDLYAAETQKAESLNLKFRKSIDNVQTAVPATPEALQAIIAEIQAAQADHQALIAQVTRFDGTYRNCDSAPIASQLFYSKGSIRYSIDFENKSYQELQSLAAFERNRKYELINKLKLVPGCIKALYDIRKDRPEAERYVTAADLESYYAQFPSERPTVAAVSAPALAPAASIISANLDRSAASQGGPSSGKIDISQGGGTR